MQKIKFKSGGIIIDKEKGVLLCIGEEKDPATGKKMLLTPGGTVKTVEVEDFRDEKMLEEAKPTDEEMEAKLAEELKDELSLTSDMYSTKYSFNAQSAVASAPDMWLYMDCYIISLKENAVVRPNFTENNPEQDVFEAIWLSWGNLVEISFADKKEFDIKPDAQLILLDAQATEKILNIDESKDYLLLPTWREVVLPELVKRGLFGV
jgi:hypothetical protein